MRAKKKHHKYCALARASRNPNNPILSLNDVCSKFFNMSQPKVSISHRPIDLCNVPSKR